MNAPDEVRALATGFTVIDFETTGSIAGWPVEPWQIGMVEVQRGALSGISYESWLRVAAERPFNHHAPGRHARLRAQLATAPALTDIWPRVADIWLLGRPLVAHNVATERGVLQRAFPLHAFGPWIDTLRLVRHCFPQLESAALEDVCDTLGLRAEVERICPAREPHDALYDATATALLLLHILSLPGWEDVSLQTLLDV